MKKDRNLFGWIGSILMAVGVISYQVAAYNWLAEYRPHLLGAAIFMGIVMTLFIVVVASSGLLIKLYNWFKYGIFDRL